MQDGNIRILKADQIQTLLAGRELDLIELVRRAYEAHAAGQSSLPHSTFLLFPEQPQNRIIALPAYLGADFGIAGVKWIASFPDNHTLGLDRASAVVIVNSLQTGRPTAILEGSLISAKRTAASAALAAQYLHLDQEISRVGLVGCGLINFEIARFLLAVFPRLHELVLYDKYPERAQRFEAKCQTLNGELRSVIARDLTTVFQQTSLISFATTAAEPHVAEIAECAPGSTILHISLRDLAPEVVLTCDNVVDDVDHVCRARTSLHLAELQVGHRDFIRCALADITRGTAPARRKPEDITVFSPFGLGILDLAISRMVVDEACAQNLGITIEAFLPGLPLND